MAAALRGVSGRVEDFGVARAERLGRECAHLEVACGRCRETDRACVGAAARGGVCHAEAVRAAGSARLDSDYAVPDVFQRRDDKRTDGVSQIPARDVVGAVRGVAGDIYQSCYTLPYPQVRGSGERDAGSRPYSNGQGPVDDIGDVGRRGVRHGETG